MPFELGGAVGEPLEPAGAVVEPFELAGAVAVRFELAGAAGEPPELGDAAAVLFDDPRADPEPGGLVYADEWPRVDGRAEPVAEPAIGAPAALGGDMAAGTEIRPDTVARPVLWLPPRAEAGALGELAAGAALTCADAEFAALAGLVLTGADAVARVVGAVPGEAGLVASEADAHSAPGAGGGGSSYP